MKISKIGVIILLLSFSSLWLSGAGGTITSTTTGGNWATTSTWVGNVVPGATDNVVIATTGTNSVSVTSGTITIANLTVNSGSILTINRQFTVNGTTLINGRVNFGPTSNFSRVMTFNGTVTLNSGSVWNETNSKATFTFASDLANSATTFTALTGTHTFTGAAKTISGSGIVSIPNLTMNGTYTSTTTITVSTTLGGTGRLTNGVSATLNVGKNFTLSNLTATATGNTVNYMRGGNQTAKVTTYYNLTISGSGTKTFATTPTVNGTLSMEGTAIIAVTSGVVTYGTNATLQYNTATSRISSSEEWITPFAATGGVVIANTGTITLDAVKAFNSGISLNVNSLASLSTNNFQLTFGGDFINNGTFTAGSSAIIINNAANQNISGFTTTGTVSMLKTGGTATFTGNVNGVALTMNGTGGTLNLGVGLTHTFTGMWTRTAGTLNGGSSTLRLGLAGFVYTGTTSAFTAGTGTVEYYASAGQTVAPVTYNNIILSGSGTKTFPGGTTTVNGVFSREGSTTVTVSGTLAYGTGSTLQYKGSVAQVTGVEFPGTWSGSGGVKIENSLGVTLNSARIINGTPLTIGSIITGSIFNDGGFQLTATGSTLNLTSGTFKLFYGSFPAFTTNNFTTDATVEYAAAATQTIKGITYNNLTISGAGTNSKTADNNITVNGILNLSSANKSATQGCLEMSSYSLTMGASATTTGTGDVTGIVTRNSFAVNTPYTFGNQYTTITLAAGGTLPSTMSFKIVLTGSAMGWITNGIKRYYDIIQTGGSSTKVTLNLHYLPSELYGTSSTINMDVFDYFIAGPTLTDDGRTSLNSTNYWVSISNLNITYVAQSSYNTNYWTLGTSTASSRIWQGGTSTDWGDATNWSGSAIPTSVDAVVIPQVATHDPTLVSATIKSLSIQTGGVLNATTGTPTLTIVGGAGAWSNLGTYNAGASTIEFSNNAASISDNTNFYNLTIDDAAAATLQTGSVVGISGTLSLSATGVLDAASNSNTVTYNGAAQTVLNPNGPTVGYYNLTLSGSGTKTMPATALSVLGSFSMNGTASATAASALAVTGDVIIGSGTTFNGGSFTHTIKGNWTNNGGTFTPGTSTVSFTNTSSAQSINGTTATQTFNSIDLAKTSKTLSVGGSTTTLTLNGDLTITSGTFAIGTAANINIKGNLSNSGTFTTGSGTVTFNGTTAQTITGANTFNNLTINSTGGVTANADQTVNAVLNMQGANYSATKGGLDMSSFTLNMGATATTTGTGDVSGIVKRTTLVKNTSYTFGNQFTTFTFTKNPMPSSLSVKLVLTGASEPYFMTTTEGISRYYDISHTGGNALTTVIMNLHYLVSELGAANEYTLDLFDDLVGATPPTSDIVYDRGRANRNLTNKWVGLNDVTLDFLAGNAFGEKYWALGNNNTHDNRIWLGGASGATTDWNNVANWEGGKPGMGLPADTSFVIIPDRAYDPILPSDTITKIGSVSLLPGGQLNSTGTDTLILTAGAGAWENLGTFNAGISLVEFTSNKATVSDTTYFNDVTIIDGATLTIGTDCIFGISGALSLSNTGILEAALTQNTVEYSGDIQTVEFPNGSVPGYYNLVFSGTGTKTMPSSPLLIAGDFYVNEATSATVLNNISVGGKFEVDTTASYSASSYTLSVGKDFNRYGTFTAATGTVTFTGTTPQFITQATTFNNLTISGTGGVTANADITVNGILNLSAANPSATKGSLEMTNNYGTYPGTTKSDYLDSHILTMGASATTTGTGDVTGTVKRTSIVANTSYTFGNQFTSLSLSAGTMPSAIAVTITIGSTVPGPVSGTDVIRDAITRSYEIVPTGGSGSNVTMNLHYLDSELTSTLSPFYLNTESKLVPIDYEIDAGGHAKLTSTEHGRAGYNFTNNYVGFSGIPISYFIQVPTSHEFRSIFTLRDFTNVYSTWNGSSSTVWTTDANWTPSGHPSSNSHVTIPDASTTNYDPALPSGSTTISTLTIEDGGVLTMGGNTLVIQSTSGGGWEDQNPTGNAPGSSTVIFNQPGTTISGTARFYNVTIEASSDITNQAGSTVRIENAVTKSGTWLADIFNNTVEYYGTAQTVVKPDGSGSYNNLILSGTGAKSMPSSPVITGNLTLSETASVTAGSNYTVGGNITLGNGTAFTGGTFTHSLGGNWTNNGATFTPGSSTINFNSTSIPQYINGTAASQTFNAISVNKSSQVLRVDGGTTTLNLKDLTITSGTFDAGTANAINLTGSWSNSGSFEAETGTVTFNGSSAQTLSGTNTFYNLVVNNAAGLTPSNNQSVYNNLYLESNNPDATHGTLDMGSFTLDMGPDATTTGTGDVSGIVRRNTIVESTLYDFGNAFTTLNLSTGGTLPGSISVKIVMSPSHTFKTDAINRYYDIIRTGGDAATKVDIKLHYLDSELNGCTKTSMDLFDGKATMTDDGNSNTDFVNNVLGIDGLDLTYVAETSFDNKYWTFGTPIIVPFTWLGHSDDWTNPSNWAGGIVPDFTDPAIIPNASTTAADPILPGFTQIATLTIQSGGVVNDGGTSSLIIVGDAGAWSNQGTFNAGTSIVQFTGAAATISGTTDFFTVENYGALTPESGNIMRISGTLNNSGVINATTSPNTIEYNGDVDPQTVIDPKGSPAGYYNLTVSGTGNKTINAGDVISVSGILSIESSSNLTLVPGSSLTSNGTLNNAAGVSGLVLQSDAGSNGSLILDNSGVDATVQRFMTHGVWHMISIPVAGQEAGTFVSDPANVIGYNSVTSEWGMMPYSPAINNWGAYFKTSTLSELNIGEGYMIRRKASGADGVVTATGTLQSGDKAVTGLVAGKWNALGNPYSSAIGVTLSGGTTDNFLDVNAGNIDTNYGALYIWDEQAGYTGPTQRSDYKVISNNGYLPELTKNYLQFGQGFLLKMKTGITSIDFTSNMQTHQVSESYMKKSNTSWPGFELLATSSSLSINTIITYNDNMTTGLDPTYDAGVLKGNPALSLYTRLVEDNGTGFAIQCLPLDGIDTFLIPVGIDFPAGGIISFTAKTSLIPAGSKVVLEDRLLGTFTDLTISKSSYEVTLPASTSGTGRFFLHTGDGKITGTLKSDLLQVYASGKRIYINGEIQEKSIISLYSTQGVLVKNFSTDGSTNMQFDAGSVSDGIYILSITDKQQKRSYKLFLGYGL